MSTVNYLDHLLQVETELNERMNLPLVEPEAFITWQGIKMISEGSLISIQGKSGSHKSRLAGEIAAVLLAPKSSNPTKLGMRRVDEDPITVAILDTELSSIFELPKALKCISTAAGVITPNNNFRLTSLRDFKRTERRIAAGKFIEHVRSNFHGKLCVIVDVVTDITSDFNSVSETGEVLDLLKTWLNVYKCAIIAVIHENPGSDKMRGHLGTEILNKASDSISIKLDKFDDSIEIKFEKCRSYKRPAKLDVIYNDTTERLEIGNSQTRLKAKHQFKALLEKLFSSNPKQTREVILKLAETIDRSEDSIDKYLKKIGYLEISGVKYNLVKSMEGKERIFEIKAFEEKPESKTE